MINTALLKKEISSAWKSLGIFLVILTMYITIIIFMYTPEMSDLMNGFKEMMPEIFAAVGMGTTAEGLLGFMVQYLYGFILFLFPSIFMVILTNSLVCKYVDTGSMAYLLATPNTRRKIVFTQWLLLNVLLLSMVIYIVACGWVTSEFLFPGELDVVNFLWVNFGLWAMYFFLGNLLFCISCLSNDSDKFIKIAGLILFFSYVCQSISSMGTNFEFLKYMTFLTLFNPYEIINQISSQWLPLALFIAGGCGLSILGITNFVKRDLPL